MSKKKRECGREYNEKKRERDYYDRTTTGRRKSMNTMTSIRTTTGGTYIIIRIIWQHHNVLKLHS